MVVPITPLGKEKTEISKHTVLQFNNSVKENIEEIKIEHFFEVTELINKLITEKVIF